MIKVSLVVLSGLAAAGFLRNRSAALRHWVLAAAIICAGATPVLEQIVPSWPVTLNPSLFGRTVEPLTLIIPVHATQASEDLGVAAANRSGFAWRLMAQRLLSGLWLVGAVCGLLTLIVGLARLARLARQSHEVVEGPWIQMVARLSRQYGIGRPVTLLKTAHPALLVTWGVRRPKIVLPSVAEDWTEDKLRIVLSHELAHIRRGDWLTQLVAELLRSVYWFNPLMWIACWRLRLESEQACDDHVLGLGIDGPQYATQLLDVARAFKESRTTVFPAPAMARPSSLERRVRAMLNTHQNRTPITWATGLPIAALLVAVTIPLAGVIASAQASSASFSGALMDAVGGSLPNTALVVINQLTNEQHAINSDQAGHFAFSGLPAGDYVLQVDRPGFAITQGHVTLDAGQHLVRDVALQVGELQETITITGSTQNGSVAQPPVKRQAVRIPEPTMDSCAPSGIGGAITQPKKIADVKPVYPSNQLAAGAGALVKIDTRIGTDGLPKDFRVAAPANQDFVNALVDAVSQWRFTQTKLDCVPVEVTMHVSANFLVQH
ncbi:MAG TPA: M56 family metallopeptidase [Vicinamibacterales bacterium]|nr:M56 family metallopeptidase [Vicinamibacterales bacterium]